MNITVYVATINGNAKILWERKYSSGETDLDLIRKKLNDGWNLLSVTPIAKRIDFENSETHQLLFTFVG